MARLAAFVGPVPPPVNGFSVICSMMLERLESRMRVDVFNRAPRPHQPVRSILAQLVLPIRYFGFCLRHRSAVLYLALSGGLGQALDIAYILIANIFRRPIFIHHHSFSYIHSQSFLNRLVFKLARNQTHIVLSHGMGGMLQVIYGLSPAKIRVISNSAFYPAAADAPRVEDPLAPITIGFLSNITVEKGFIEFFCVLSHLTAEGIAFRAKLAGPISAAAHDQFTQLLASSVNVDYLGAIYDEAKQRFYRQIDIFLFPTKYANEAEPLVLIEAMQAGAHVIACDRGAISEMLENGSGLAFPSDTIVSSATEHIKRFSRDRAALAVAQDLSVRQSHRLRETAAQELKRLLNEMADGLHGSDSCESIR